MKNLNKPSRLPEAVTKVYELLEPFEEPDRLRVLQSVLALFGGEPLALGGASTTAIVGRASAESPSGHAKGSKGQAWLRKHALTEHQLETVFHLDGSAELIASPPGSTKREQTINAYLLLGAQELLSNDEAKFSEAAAVALCKKVGCHDPANHALTRSKFGNKITGSKEAGYALTIPGLDAAAAAIKALAPSN